MKEHNIEHIRLTTKLNENVSWKQIQDAFSFYSSQVRENILEKRTIGANEALIQKYDHYFIQYIDDTRRVHLNIDDYNLFEVEGVVQPFIQIISGMCNRDISSDIIMKLYNIDQNSRKKVVKKLPRFALNSVKSECPFRYIDIDKVQYYIQFPDNQYYTLQLQNLLIGDTIDVIVGDLYDRDDKLMCFRGHVDVTLEVLNYLVGGDDSNDTSPTVFTR